jgi:hypothetical protein
MFVAWLLKNQDHENQYVADWRTKDEYFIPQANQDIYCVYCVTVFVPFNEFLRTISSKKMISRIIQPLSF